MLPNSTPSREQQHVGTVHHESLERGKTSGWICVRGGGVSFETEEETLVELPLQDLDLKLGGTSDRLVFFSHPQFPGWSLQTADKSILNHQALDASHQLSQTVSDIKKRRRMQLGILMSVVFLLVAGLISLIVFRNSLVTALVNQIPISLEIQLGTVSQKKFEMQSTLLIDSEIETWLSVITTPLMDSIPDRKFEYHFNIIEDPSLNAFALPGGHIYMNTGFLLAANSPEEIAGVLAHEISHVRYRHSLKTIIESVGTVFIVKTILGSPDGLLGVVERQGILLYSRKFSREAELEADDKGFDLLVAAGIHPQGMIDFFVKMELQSRLVEDVLETPLKFYSTHPITSERIDRLEQRLRGLEDTWNPSEYNFDFEKFQNKIKQLIH